LAVEALLPVYLVTGTDRPKVRRALERLRARFPEGSVELLSAEKQADREAVTGADAVAACNALGLFGDDGGRLVVVERAERWKAVDVDALAEYLQSPAPGAVLALVGDEPLKGRLPEVVAKHGKVLAYEAPRPRDLPSWVREHFERRGVRMHGGAAQALVELVGEDSVALETEIDKIAAWAGGEEVGRPQIEMLAVGAGEDPAWALTDAWGSRDLGKALEASERALEHERPYVLALRLASHVANVRTAQAMADEGLGAAAVAKRLRFHEFRAKKALAHSQNYSRDELDSAVVRLAELEAALKGASRLAPELELELALIEITGP
jgi:DNA polymerase III subunit delta